MYEVTRNYTDKFQSGLEIEVVCDSIDDLLGADGIGTKYVGRQIKSGSKAFVAGVGEFIMTPSLGWVSADGGASELTVTLGASLTYSGSEQTQEVSSVKKGTTTLTEDTDYKVYNNKATGAGTYGLQIVGIGDYAGTVITVAFTVAKLSLTKPTKSADLTWSGNEQTVTLTNFVSAFENVSGDKATEIGSYTSVVSLKDAANTKWSDGTTAPIEIAWAIGKATPAIVLDPDDSDTGTTLTIGGDSYVISASYPEEAASIIAGSAPSGICTHQIVAQTYGGSASISVTARSAGETVLTITYPETAHYTEASVDIPITVEAAAVVE